MIIRKAGSSDLQGIISVLKASLGESSSRKTSEVWSYKHLENPFGESLVLIAEEDGEIIGVRAFMKWTWHKGGQQYSCYRAVDTATHPDYQGKGIFKKLTLRALEIAKEFDGDFVFNTPNDQSRPGYIKMGWQVVDKVKIKIVPNFNFFSGKNDPENQTSVNPESIRCSDSVLEEYNAKLASENNIFTPKTSEFLKWRYQDCKLQNYFILNEEEYFVAAYIKEHSRYKELRISELICTKSLHESHLKKKISQLAASNKALIITYSSKINLRSNLGLIGNFGPILTLKQIQDDFQKKDIFLNINNWANSIGDLELF